MRPTNDSLVRNQIAPAPRGEAGFHRVPSIPARQDDIEGSLDALPVGEMTKCLADHEALVTGARLGQCLIPLHSASLRGVAAAAAVAEAAVLEHPAWAGRELRRRGAGLHAMSGIDMALWDIKGKALGLPVWKLLGGGFHQKIRCYASSLFGATPAKTGELARRYKDQGFTAVKFGWDPMGQDEKTDIALVREGRKGLLGWAIVLSPGFGRPRGPEHLKSRGMMASSNPSNDPTPIFSSIAFSSSGVRGM